MFDDSSWIKIYRKITEWEWWDDAECVKLWLWLLCKAQTKDRKWKGRIIQRGQLVTTLEGMKSECKISIDKIRRRLEYLRNSGAIHIETTNGNHFITILNYGLYQDRNTDSESETTNEPQADNKQTINEPQADNKPTINEPQADNKQTTPIKELKNIRNNNIRENPNIIIQERKNERIFFNGENEKKIFSIEEIKNSLAEAGIYWKPQGYLDFKENNENPEAPRINYNGGIVKAAKQFQKLHPEIIQQAKQKKTSELTYAEVEVAPDVKETLQMLLDNLSPFERKTLACVKFVISDRGDEGCVFLPTKVFWEMNQNLVLALNEKLKEFYGLEKINVRFY